MPLPKWWIFREGQPVVPALPLPRDHEHYSRSPGREQVEEWHQLGQERREKRHMPAEQHDQRRPYPDIQRVIPRRRGTFHEERQQADLRGIGGDGDGQCREMAPVAPARSLVRWVERHGIRFPFPLTGFLLDLTPDPLLP